MEVWIQQDSILRSWPKYSDVRDVLSRELSLTINLESATVTQLCDGAAGLRRRFWREEGPLLAQGYQKPYKARVLLEIAHEREPANLAVSDQLVETILTSHPLDCYDPAAKVAWAIRR